MSQMKLNEQYENLYKDSIEKIKADAYRPDDYLNHAIDNRFGLTLILRPPELLKQEIQKVLNEFRSIEPDQYFYPNSDIHVTVLSIIPCYEGFDLSQITVEDYINIINESTDGLQEFSLNFKGLTASTNCIIVRGFLTENVLQSFRKRLQSNFKISRVQHNMGNLYSVDTAHATILRLRHKLTNKEAYLKLMEKYKNHDFGSFKVSSIELVYSDWYQRKATAQSMYSIHF